MSISTGVSNTSEFRYSPRNNEWIQVRWPRRPWNRAFPSDLTTRKYSWNGHRISDRKQSSFSNLSVSSPTSQLILQPFRRFTFVTAHSTTLPSLYLRHSSFSNPSVASPTSHFIHQPFFRFSYVTGSSLTSPCEPSMLKWLKIYLIEISYTIKYYTMFC